jgi:hypothetical protein
VLPDPSETPAAIVAALEKKIDKEYPPLPDEAPAPARAEDVADADAVDPAAAGSAAAEPSTVEPPD